MADKEKEKPSESTDDVVRPSSVTTPTTPIETPPSGGTKPGTPGNTPGTNPNT